MRYFDWKNSFSNDFQNYGQYPRNCHLITKKSDHGFCYGFWYKIFRLRQDYSTAIWVKYSHTRLNWDVSGASGALRTEDFAHFEHAKPPKSLYYSAGKSYSEKASQHVPARFWGVNRIILDLPCRVNPSGKPRYVRMSSSSDLVPPGGIETERKILYQNPQLNPWSFSVDNFQDIDRNSKNRLRTSFPDQNSALGQENFTR